MSEKPKQIIGVVGLGMMGGGIASCLIGNGFVVRALSANPELYPEVQRRIEASLRELVQYRAFPASILDNWRQRYLEADSLQQLADCDFVIETIVEDLSAKQSLYFQLETILRPHVTIASNTSGLAITDLQEPMKDPSRLIGMHWADPSHITRFMEVIRGDQTSDAAYAATLALAQACGKDVSLVQHDIKGFIVNRLQYALYREALHLLESGVADVQTIDDACRNVFGLWAGIVGPFRAIDIFGFATCVNVMDTIFPTLSNASGAPAMLRKMVDDGARGMSPGAAGGKGFYSYTPEQCARWREIFYQFARQMTQIQDSYFPRSTAQEKK